MKVTSRLISLALVAVILLSTAATAEPRLYRLSVEGMVCPLCAIRVKRSLSAIDGVRDVKIDLTDGKAFVTMAEEATLAEAEARAVIASAGFNLRSFEERPNAP